MLRSRRAVIHVLMLPVVAGTIFGACSSDPSPATPATAATTADAATAATAVTAATAESGEAVAADATVVASFTAMLSGVPDTAEIRATPLYYSNLIRVRNGERAPTALADLQALAGVSPAFSIADPLRSALGDEAELAPTLGFDLRDVDASIEAAALPDPLGIFVGRFDGDAIAAGLATTPGGDALVDAADGAVRTFDLGVDGEVAIRQVSPIRQVGEAVRIGLSGSTLVWARTDAQRGAALAALSGDAASLAADAPAVDLARRLDDAGVTSATLLLAPLDGAPWQQAALGEVLGLDTSVLHEVLTFATEAAATEAAASLRSLVETGSSLRGGAAWSSLLTIRSIEVEGSTVVASFDTTSPGLAVRLVTAQDNLLLLG